MNRSKLKNYAPQARRDFIRAVTDRAAAHGIRLVRNAIEFSPITQQGDVAVIEGRPFPIGVAEKRRKLQQRIEQLEAAGTKPAQAFKQVMDAMAYTWFNRLVAIRYMELHGYLDHGYRVLSNPDAAKSTPEIVEHAEHVDLPGLDKQQVVDLKLDGTKESQLYRMLLIAQCNALHSAMPFLFEKIDDETELLLPDNLLHSDSLIRKLVSEIDEEDWQQVEIIGWLYQFYISERKDEVIGKVVASEDIPAATQLFTPNWIVKYLVQNTIGRQWLATYPESPLRQQMEYYIEPAEQTPEVQEQLKAITPTSLNPEELTLLDPACGSGHILVEAYDLFKAIYQERGYRAKDIPSLILTKNLFGLEIDDRAAQLAAFALMMKARADDRRIFDSEAKPNVVAIQESKGLNAEDITRALNAPINKDDVPGEFLIEEMQEEKDGLFSKKALAEKGHVSEADIFSLLELFENAKTFGSLIQLPPNLVAKLPEIEKRLDDVSKFGNLTHVSAQVLRPLLRQAQLLIRQYVAVVANPPYMGWKYLSGLLKKLVESSYKDAKGDLYSCFVVQSLRLATSGGFVGLITIPNWMSLSTFEAFRRKLFEKQAIDSFILNGRGVFGSDFGSCAFVIRSARIPSFRGIFRKLFDKQGSVSSNDDLQQRFHAAKTFYASVEELKAIPGHPVAFTTSKRIREVFAACPPLSSFGKACSGHQTGDNGLFLRYWYETDHRKIGFGVATPQEALASRKRWFPHKKGGEFRRWYGNCEYIMDWESDGKRIRKHPSSALRNPDYQFREGVTWSHTSISVFSARYSEIGSTFNVEGPTFFSANPKVFLGYLCSAVANELFHILSPTVHFLVGTVSLLPHCESSINRKADAIEKVVERLIELGRADWNSCECAWGFQGSALACNGATALAFEAWNTSCTERLDEAKRLEEENNRLFIEAYGLQDELSPEVPDDQITLYRPDREEDIKRLISYAIGCMMGRYSLDKPGLVYAHSGNQGFDPRQYETFRADDDGIVPLLESDWGIRDDVTNRFAEFVGVAWPKEHLEENLKFVADSLGPIKDEQPTETIRRYLATGFYKHHLSMYKKRPIYWLFSSGKHRAFQCLVYLHRYNEGTLARMRTEYVIPLQGKINDRIEQLEDDRTSAASAAHRRKIEKELELRKKQKAELIKFDELLRHYADMRISLDLDDGVKVNYAKFGDLLDSVKQVCGKQEEE